jgi:hypothetical protein
MASHIGTRQDMAPVSLSTCKTARIYNYNKCSGSGIIHLHMKHYLSVMLRAHLSVKTALCEFEPSLFAR